MSTMIHQYRPTFDWRELWAAWQPGVGVKEFESALAARVGARYALAFAYGRSALVAFLQAQGIQQSEVILPAYTCHVVAEAVVASGNSPVFVDIDLRDYNMDLHALKSVLSPQTRAIVVTHMHGYRADVAAIRNIVGDRQIAIVEDAALLGPVPWTMPESDKGDAIIFSYSPGKHLYAVQGGGLVTDSPALHENLARYQTQQMSGLPWQVWLKRVGRLLTAYVMLYPRLFEAWNRLNQKGPMRRVRNSLGITPTDMPPDSATRLADFQARIGLVQLAKFDTIVARHRAWAELYDQQLGDLAGLQRPPIIPGATFSHYPVRVIDRDEIEFGRRMRARGIEIGTAFRYVVPHLPAYRSYARQPYPCAEQTARQIVNLPNYATLSASDVRYIAETTQHCLTYRTEKNNESG